MDIVRKKAMGMVVWDEWQKSYSEVSFHAVKNKHIWVYVCLHVYMHMYMCVCTLNHPARGQDYLILQPAVYPKYNW